jgi:hypothetical protein
VQERSIEPSSYCGEEILAVSAGDDPAGEALMGLYLCIFAGDDRDEELDDEELGAVDVGGYSDFGEFRDVIARLLEGGR